MEQSPEVERIKQDYASQLSALSPEVGQYISKCIQGLCRSACSDVNNLAIDELSEKVQKFYQLLAKCMDAHNVNQGIISISIYKGSTFQCKDTLITILSYVLELKEQVLDYCEKFTMTVLHRNLFCPPTTTDEEKDLAIQKRWVLPVESGEILYSLWRQSLESIQLSVLT